MLSLEATSHTASSIETAPTARRWHQQQRATEMQTNKNKLFYTQGKKVFSVTKILLSNIWWSLSVRCADNQHFSYTQPYQIGCFSLSRTPFLPLPCTYTRASDCCAVQRARLANSTKTCTAEYLRVCWCECINAKLVVPCLCTSECWYTYSTEQNINKKQKKRYTEIHKYLSTAYTHTHTLTFCYLLFDSIYY